MCELWCFAAAVVAAATGATAAAFCFAVLLLLVASAQIATKLSAAQGGVEWGGAHVKPNS